MAKVATILFVRWFLGEGGHMVNGAAVTSPDFMAVGPPVLWSEEERPTCFFFT
jgi:hypothetical protein